MGKIWLVALLRYYLVSRDCCVALPRVCLQFVIVVFPDQTHFLFYSNLSLQRNILILMDHLDIMFYAQQAMTPNAYI